MIMQPNLMKILDPFWFVHLALKHHQLTKYNRLSDDQRQGLPPNTINL
jgi:hypothetical protein